MASVRVKPAFRDQGLLLLTFRYDTSIVYDASYYDGTNHSAQYGMLVALVSDSTVGLGSSGNYPIGKLVKIEPNTCTVEVAGTIEVPYASGYAPTVGLGVTVDGAGNALAGASPRAATERGIVLALDTTNLLAYVLLS
jgi:hypothetical protein